MKPNKPCILIYVGFRTSSPPKSGTNGEEDSIFLPVYYR